MNTSIDMEKAEKFKKNSELKGEHLVQDFTKSMKGYSSDAMESITEGYDTALSWVKKNPLQAAAIGAGIGFVVGAAIRKFGKRKA